MYQNLRFNNLFASSMANAAALGQPNQLEMALIAQAFADKQRLPATISAFGDKARQRYLENKAIKAAKKKKGSLGSIIGSIAGSIVAPGIGTAIGGAIGSGFDTGNVSAAIPGAAALGVGGLRSALGAKEGGFFGNFAGGVKSTLEDERLMEALSALWQPDTTTSMTRFGGPGATTQISQGSRNPYNPFAAMSQAGFGGGYGGLPKAPAALLPTTGIPPSIGAKMAEYSEEMKDWDLETIEAFFEMMLEQIGR